MLFFSPSTAMHLSKSSLFIRVLHSITVANIPTSDTINIAKQIQAFDANSPPSFPTVVALHAMVMTINTITDSTIATACNFSL